MIMIRLYRHLSTAGGRFKIKYKKMLFTNITDCKSGVNIYIYIYNTLRLLPRGHEISVTKSLSYSHMTSPI